MIALADVLGSTVVQQIQKSGEIVFHSAGDTGGIKEPSHQFAVGDALSADSNEKDYGSGRAAFLFHLGDVFTISGRNAIITTSFTIPIAITLGPSSRFRETTMACYLPASR